MWDATPLFKLYAKNRLRQLEQENPVESQRRTLLRLVSAARRTRFGRDHGFDRIKTVEGYQEQVPLRSYEEFWTQYLKPDFPKVRDVIWPGTIPYFALSSGTTSGKTKYIPYTMEMHGANRTAALDIFVHHLHNRPESRILAGRNFMLGGSTVLERLAPGIYSGDLSGIAGHLVPWWARMRYFPPRELETIPDWEERISQFAEHSLAEDIRTISGIPSWLLVFLERLAELRPGVPHRIESYYPNLELLIHGGINFTPYRDTFRQLLEGSRAETREVYPASEAFLAIADRGDGEGMRLLTDTGIFYEFVPLEEMGAPNPTRHWLGTVEPGVNYAVILATNAGLWAYSLGDTVRFVDLDPPRLLVTGRVSYTLSAFGEHLIEEEIVRSVTAAAHGIDAEIADYSVGAVFSGDGGEGAHHLYIVEFTDGLPDEESAAVFADLLDRALSETNSDYRSLRKKGGVLERPRIKPVPHGTFAAWMKSRGRLGGQNKVPRILNDADLFRSLAQFAPSSQ